MLTPATQYKATIKNGRIVIIDLHENSIVCGCTTWHNAIKQAERLNKS